MKKDGIICGRDVVRPLHQLLTLSAKQYSINEKLTTESISLPIYPTLTEKDIGYITEKFINILKN